MNFLLHRRLHYTTATHRDAATIALLVLLHLKCYDMSVASVRYIIKLYSKYDRNHDFGVTIGYVVACRKLIWIGRKHLRLIGRITSSVQASFIS